MTSPRSGRARGRGGRAARRSRDRRPRGHRRRDMPPGVSRRGSVGPSRRTRPARAGAPGCASRRDRFGARRRTPGGADGERRRGHRGARGSRSARTGPGAPHVGARRRSLGPRCGRSGRQLAPTLAAASPQDRAAGAVGHPVAEAVPAGPATVVGLVRALHGDGLLGAHGADRGLGPRPTGRAGRGGTIWSGIPDGTGVVRARPRRTGIDKRRARTGTGTRRGDRVEAPRRPKQPRRPAGEATRERPPARRGPPGDTPSAGRRNAIDVVQRD